jgi:uncharacterized surface protein with fasciclin (FAS1) repeats
MADIVDTAVNAGSFNTLVEALKAANLADTLKEPGPYTVFAPTDEAFGKLPEGTLDKLLKDTPELAKILTYHVVSGKLTAEEVAKQDKAMTLEGGELTIAQSGGTVKVDAATVMQPDVEADNGVIHAIDTVLLPSQPKAE